MSEWHVAISTSEAARIVRLLLLDVVGTLGPDHEAVVGRSAAHVALYVDDPSWYQDRLVEDVQQYFHDCFVDVTWPACPRHSTHPLWLHGDFWCCERDQEPIARLGELSSVWSPAGSS